MERGRVHLNWPEAFFLTQVIEMPIYVYCLKRWGHHRAWFNVVFIAFAASAITHPLVWFVFPKILSLKGNYPLFFWAVELFAWSVEGCYFKFFKVKYPWMVSLIGNGASAGVGLILNGAWRQVFYFI